MLTNNESGCSDDYKTYVGVRLVHFREFAYRIPTNNKIRFFVQVQNENKIQNGASSNGDITSVANDENLRFEFCKRFFERVSGDKCRMASSSPRGSIQQT